MRHRHNQNAHHGPTTIIITHNDDHPAARGRGPKRKGHHMKTTRHGHAGHRPHRPHSHRRRPLRHGDLPLLILALIAQKPRHGYDLIGQIETRTKGAYKPSPGVIYPALEVLQDLGQIRMVPEGGKKSYEITPEGQAELAANTVKLERIEDRLEALGSPEERDDPNSVRAAMQQLHHTVRSLMRSGDISDAGREKIATLLSETRRSVEDIAKE